MVFDYVMPLSIDDVPLFVKEILAKLGTLRLKEDISFGLQLCLQEALVNAVKHGNRMDPHKKVSLHVDATPRRIIIEVENEGEGFDYRHLSSPLKRENLQKTSGRGIFLIKQFMDVVDFLEKGTKIRMIKHLNKGGENED